MSDRCEHTDLPTEFCAHCLNHDDMAAAVAGDRAAYLASGRWVSARFPGRCAACGERTIAEGDPIRHADGIGWYGALCCDDPKEAG